MNLAPASALCPLYVACFTFHSCNEPEWYDVFTYGRAPFRVGSTQNLWCYYMRLIGQVLWENLLLTCIGGLLGLLISYLIVLTASDWILTLFDSYTDVEKTPFLSFEMLFNPTVFCASFGLCVLLNLISALIPAIWALRRNIIQSLNSKR